MPARPGSLSFGAGLINIGAVPEGTLVFPHEPLLRISGPIVQAQIVDLLRDLQKKLKQVEDEIKKLEEGGAA